MKMPRPLYLYLSLLLCSHTAVFGQNTQKLQRKDPIAQFTKSNRIDFTYARGEIGGDYEDLSELLVKIVEETKGESSDDKLHKTLAIDLLGQLRCKFGVEVLISNLMFFPQEYHGESPLQNKQAFFPAAASLVKIGNPSIDALIRRIAYAQSKDERHLASWALMKIDADNKEISLLRLELAKKGRTLKDRNNIIECQQYIQNFDSNAPFPEAKAQDKK